MGRFGEAVGFARVADVLDWDVVVGQGRDKSWPRWSAFHALRDFPLHADRALRPLRYFHRARGYKLKSPSTQLP